MALYDTVAGVVSDAAVELGLGAITDVFASTDANVVQLRGILKSFGRELAMERHWVHLTAEGTIATANGTASYNLPADFSRMIDQSGWNRTSRFPMDPLSPQEWQFLKASTVTVSLSVLFRPRESTVEIYPTPTTVQSLKFEYASRYWVRNTGGTTLDKDAPTLNTDVLLFDSTLLVKGLKLRFLEDKGFDSSAAANRYAELYDKVISANAEAAPVLSLNGRIRTEDRYINMRNLPDSGYGA